MGNARNRIAMGIAACLVSGVAVSQEPDYPVVPVPTAKSSVMTDNVPAPIASTSSNVNGAETKLPGSYRTSEGSRLDMEPGVNEIVPVAVNHLNRIVTPFANPVVTTSSGVTTEVRDNVVYVGTDKMEPATLFVTERGSEAEALSLTLVPKQIPPRELFLTLRGQPLAPARFANSDADKWETQQSYVETLRTLLRKVALGQLPQGYTIHQADGSSLPNCAQPGLEFSFVGGQTLIGHRLTVNVGVARNISGQPLEFEEASCGSWDVAAVSAFPRNVLGPNERTEVYVVTKQVDKDVEHATARPSLLGGGE